MLVVAATDRELAHVRGFETFACGVGPVDAAARTALMLAERRPDAVLHVGIAGSRELALLSVVLGSVSVYSDLSAAIPIVDRVPPDAALFERVHAALPDAVPVPIGTSAAVGGGGEDVEAMEGFGVLRACALAEVPAVGGRVAPKGAREADPAEGGGAGGG